MQRADVLMAFPGMTSRHPPRSSRSRGRVQRTQQTREQTSCDILLCSHDLLVKRLGFDKLFLGQVKCVHSMIDSGYECNNKFMLLGLPQLQFTLLRTDVQTLTLLSIFAHFQFHEIISSSPFSLAFGLRCARILNLNRSLKVQGGEYLVEERASTQTIKWGLTIIDTFNLTLHISGKCWLKW
jgi:hypothetical protein